MSNESDELADGEGPEYLRELLSRQDENTSRAKVALYQIDRYYRVGKWVEDMLSRQGTTLTLCRRAGRPSLDEELSVEIRRDDKKPQTVNAGALEDVVELVRFADKKRKCRGPCGLERPYSDFSSLKSGPDGKNRYCRFCERERVKRHGKKKGGAGEAVL